MVFARAPVPGQAKTRLIPALGEEGAARLHAWLVDRTLATVALVDGVSVELWCSPSADDAVLRSCAARYGMPLHTQRGDDLGARMCHAFDAALRAAPWAILVGTDIPELRARDMQRAVAAMESGVDAVVGPAFDGGYYLLGLRQTSSSLFDGIPWGTERVLAMTQARLWALGWAWTTITRRRDLDQPQDLADFPDLRGYAGGGGELVTLDRDPERE